MTLFAPLEHSIGYLLHATGMTLLITVLVLAPATALGIGLTALRLQRGRLVGSAIDGYLFLVRGLPLLILLTLVYYLLPLTGFDLPPLWDVVLVLALYYAPLMSEVFRAGIDALPHGQWDAARGLGMRRRLLLRHVIFPQALRLAGPPYINLCVNLIKATSLASVVGVLELTRASHEVVERTLAPFQIFVASAMIYFCICYALARLGRLLEGGCLAAR